MEVDVGDTRGSLVLSGAEGQPKLEPGDALRVARLSPGVYTFVDFERRTPLLALAAVKSAAAILGTSASLIVTALLAVAAVDLAHLTGTSITEAGLLRGGSASVWFEGSFSPAW